MLNDVREKRLIMNELDFSDDDMDALGQKNMAIKLGDMKLKIHKFKINGFKPGFLNKIDVQFSFNMI